MNCRLKIAAAAMLAASVVASYGQTNEAAPTVKKHAATRTAKTPAPTVAEQIQALKEELEGQINSMKSALAEKDVQLQKAQQAAADAQAAAARAETAAGVQQQAVTENNTAVTALQSAVTDLKGTQASLATTISDETSKIKKDIGSPDFLHYKGIALTPGGFVAAETVYRNKATGGDIPTAFSSIPYEGADAYSLSEFYGSARQSRISLLAQGKTSWGTLRGYYEADFLGTGITSNNNQSNSYAMRMRILYAQAQTNSGWTVAGGQLWSMATEGKKGIPSAPGDIMTPQTIDPNYVPGFVWTRQYGFRVVKSFDNNKFAIGVSAENPQLIYSAALAGDTPYAVLGSAGANGGNYNAAISAAAATTYVKSFANVPGAAVNVGGTIYTASPTYVANYATIQANTNITNISFNKAPDMIVKLTADPGFGHYEVFGIAGFAHEQVYPGVDQNRVKYGGDTDNEMFSTPLSGSGGSVDFTCSATSPNACSVLAASTAGHYTNSIILGGFGASARVPVIKDKLSVGFKGLYGPGVGRYGNTTLSDVTNNARGELRPIHNLSGLATIEVTPTPRLFIYLNYGGDYAARTDYANTDLTLKDPTATFCETGTNGTNIGTNCSAAPTATQLAAGGKWGNHFTQTPAMTAIGYGSRYASGSATCGATPGTPGYQSGSTGYLPGGSGCGNNTRSVQEVTGGYWFDFYKGDKGRLRQGFQYGYAVREGWSAGASGTTTSPLYGAKGIDNMFWTSFRYYLP